MAGNLRTEADSMGELSIPSDMLYGASTQRAANNFPISGVRMNRSFIFTLGSIKRACAQVNKDLGQLDPKLSEAIQAAANRVTAGELDHHFVVDVFQTGSGTSTNMNANEVIANLAIDALGGQIGSKTPVHPNDHVNMGQSSNDVIPTALHVSLLHDIQKRLIPELKQLCQSLSSKSKAFAHVIKTGRTHLQDATLITLGQEFSGYASQIDNCTTRLEDLTPQLGELAIGGTAVGTGINTHKEFGARVAKELASALDLPLKEARNHFEAQAAKDACVQAAGTFKTLATALMKIANDVRWLSSGPRCGLGEITIPAVQPGSSIMPGKVNPVIPEAVTMVAAQVIGNDLAVTIGNQAGNFELNVMMPMMARNLLESAQLLTNVCHVFRTKCIDGIEADAARCEATIEQGLSMVTSFAPVIGYDKAAALAKEAYKTGKTIREIAKEKKVLPDAEIDTILDPKKML